MRVVLLSFVLAVLVAPQDPTGSIEGVVRDRSGAVIPGVSVDATNHATLNPYSGITNENGRYLIHLLPAGNYKVGASLPGFQTSDRNPVTVNAGAKTDVDFYLDVVGVSTEMTVRGAQPLVQDSSFTVGGTVPRELIDTLPLNGQNAAWLYPLGSPGVRVARTFNRTLADTDSTPLVGGGAGWLARQTMDGASTMAIGNGGSIMDFPNDAVEEVRVSIVNWDLSAGPTVSGVFSTVARQGGNDFHGGASFFFRDHNLSAYPALTRDTANPDPFFQRRETSLMGSGPIWRPNYFVLGSWAHTEQRGVLPTTLLGPDFSHLSRVTSSPFHEDLVTFRVDALHRAHQAFLRYSHDGNESFEPGATQGNAYPSQWARNSATVDQWVFGLNSSTRRDAVNSLRLSLLSPNSRRSAAHQSACSDCLGMGLPAINIRDHFGLGNSSLTLVSGQRFQIHDYVALKTGSHFAVFGVDWEHNRGGQIDWGNEPATLTLWAPSAARNAQRPVPQEFHTMDDVLKLPVQNIVIAVGDRSVPQANGESVRSWDTFRLYYQDEWRVHPRAVVKYGLGWNVDGNHNYDLTLPPLLAPIFGENNLGRRRKQWTNFSPLFGVIWRIPPGNNIVVRAGAGRFFSFLYPSATTLDAERAALGPAGLGRRTFQREEIPNLVRDIPGSPFGALLIFSPANGFTGADLLNVLPATREYLLERHKNQDRSIQQFQASKTGTLLAPVFPVPSAFHANVGISKQFTENFSLNADLAWKRFTHLGIGTVDMNLTNRSLSLGGPVIKTCEGTQKSDPSAVCLNGRVQVAQPVGEAEYRALLVRAEQRFSRGFQFVASWAYSRNIGTSVAGENGFNLEKWHENRGPLPSDVTHNVSLAGRARLPHKLEVSFNFSYLSAPPFNAYLAGSDFNGDGFNSNSSDLGDLLPGSTFNIFNRGMDKGDLVRLVFDFNERYAGRRDEQGNLIPRITLPEEGYAFGDTRHSLDLRLSRTFRVHERVNLTLIGEVFNVYNAANLSGYSGDLTNVDTFGQPTARSSQVFGSGGPRAFQLGLRARF